MKTTNVTAVVMMLGAALSLTVPASHAQDTGAAGAGMQQCHAAPQQVNQHSMMTGMEATQKRLDDLVAQMNTAQGPDKIDRMAAVVNEMVAMHKRMSMMMEGMMHMPPAGGGNAAEPLTGDVGGAGHAEHHTP